jgi:hypothetical protein
MGEDRFIDYCKQHNVKDMTPALAERIKNLYRGMFTGVVQYWNVCQYKLLPAMVEGYDMVLPNADFPILRTGRDILGGPAITLPGGLQIKYPHLTRTEDGDWYYINGNPDAVKPEKAKLFGGKVMENQVQALAGVMLREIIIELNEPDVIDIISNVHDEAPCLVNETPEITHYLELKTYNNSVPKAERVDNPLPDIYVTRRCEEVMTRERPWIPGLPVAIEYDFGYRYGDCK